MSADNGVYVLVSRGPKQKKHYRVVYATCIENIFYGAYGANYPASIDGALFNRDELKRYFGDARILTDRRKAEGYAMRVEEEALEELGSLEYGTVWLEYGHIPFPTRPKRTRRRRTPSTATS